MGTAATVSGTVGDELPDVGAGDAGRCTEGGWVRAGLEAALCGAGTTDVEPDVEDDSAEDPAAIGVVPSVSVDAFPCAP